MCASWLTETAGDLGVWSVRITRSIDAVDGSEDIVLCPRTPRPWLGDADSSPASPPPLQVESERWCLLPLFGVTAFLNELLSFLSRLAGFGDLPLFGSGDASPKEPGR